MQPDIASASLLGTLAALHLSPEKGLTHAEADSRRKEQGYNDEWRAAGVLETLRRRLYASPRVLRDASWQVVPARELVAGDIVRVRPGDIVPADVNVPHEKLSEFSENEDKYLFYFLVQRPTMNMVLKR
jgi:E1-E2 ATPase